MYERNDLDPCSEIREQHQRCEVEKIMVPSNSALLGEGCGAWRRR